MTKQKRFIIKIVMPIEIEHKYLINKDVWKNIIPKKSITIQQAYLLISPEKSVRVRVK